MTTADSDQRPAEGKTTAADQAASGATIRPLSLIASRTAATVCTAAASSSRMRTSTASTPPFIQASPATVVRSGSVVPRTGACIRIPSGRMSSAVITTSIPKIRQKPAIMRTLVDRAMRTSSKDFVSAARQVTSTL